MYFTATKRVSVANWAEPLRKLTVHHWGRINLHVTSQQPCPKALPPPSQSQEGRAFTHGQKHLLFSQPLSTMPEQVVHWQSTILTSLDVQNSPLAKHKNCWTVTQPLSLTLFTIAGMNQVWFCQKTYITRCTTCFLVQIFGGALVSHLCSSIFVQKEPHFSQWWTSALSTAQNDLSFPWWAALEPHCCVGTFTLVTYHFISQPFTPSAI